MLLSPLQAGLRIIKDTTLYRLRRREANNLATSTSLMVALGLHWDDVAIRFGFAALLNVYLYLMNDYFDIERDLGSPQKDHVKARYMADHRSAAVGALIVLGAALLAVALLHSWLLTVALGASTVLVLSYSAWLKRVPIMDVVAMILTGVAISLVGLPPDSVMGFKLVGLLGVICASFEVIQVVRDEPGDRLAGITTTAVLLGARWAAWIFRGIVVGAAVYTYLVVGSPLGLALLPTLLLPLDPQRASRTWDLCRILFGLVWLGLLAQVWLGWI